MEQIELELKLREGIGKGVSKKLRKAKNIPGIIYGNNEANVNVIAEETSFTKLISKQKGEHAILNIKIKDNSDSIIAEKNAIIKNLQRDAITEDIIHVDFQTISMDKKLRTNVPLVAQGKAEGIKSF
ncbi:MAG: 50S ribosomal protein L25 [Candidatus Firestonebacteria bacterium]|nr:50S ribosomal protein L25 [Candidatus Firestonebacteria bacterium]